MIVARFASTWAARRRSRRALLTTSAKGIPDPPAEVFQAARWRILERCGIARLSRRIYRDRFFTTVDREYAGFTTLPFPAAEKRVINKRVLACIRTIAAFSAWEEVSWAMIAVGFTVATIVAAAVGLAMLVTRVGLGGSWLDVAIATLLVILAIIGARRVALAVPRVWPRSAFIMVVLAAVAASLVRGIMGYAERSWQPPLAWTMLDAVRLRLGTGWASSVEAALLSAVALWVVFSLALSLSAISYIRATSRRIERFPEEEIIQCIVLTLVELADPKIDWRSALQRAKLVDRMEWVARCFGGEYVRRYTGGDRATDALLDRTAQGCAARFRAQKRMLVFPSLHTYDDFTTFLWTTLRSAAVHSWDAIAIDDVPDAAPSRRQRIFSAMRTAGATFGPALFGIGFQYTNADPGIRANVLITGFTWSALMVLAMLNPKQFEAQTSAAKSLGDIFRKSG